MSTKPTEFHSIVLSEFPSFDQVYVYFSQKGMSGLEAHHFYIVHQTRGWRKQNGAPIKKWKAAAYQWITEAWKMNRILYDRSIR